MANKLKNLLRKSRKARKLLINHKGMTLIEVLVGLALLGIIAVLMGGFFVNSLGLISRAGDLDRTGYTAAKVIENAIDGQALTQDGSDIIINIDETNEETVQNTAQPLDVNKTINISFPGRSIDVTGYQKKIKSTGYRNDVTIEVFIPNE